MNVDFVYRSLRTAVIVTFLFTPFLALRSPIWATSFCLASLWSVANVWAISQLVISFLGKTEASKGVLWILVKFPVLYGLGIFLLLTYNCSPPGVAVGFHVVFVVFVLKAVAISLGIGQENRKNEDTATAKEDSTGASS